MLPAGSGSRCLDKVMTGERRILLGVTGASGSIYAERLLTILADTLPRIYLIVTDSGKQVIRHELPPSASLRGKHENKKIRVYDNQDFFAPVASGTSTPTDVVLIPCSMGTLSRVSQSSSSNLLERVCDVVLKERKKLVIVPRETPLHAIHLENMLRLSRAGAHIIPASPAFYQQPKTLDDIANFIVGRVLDCLEIPHNLTRRWNTRML